MDGEVFVTELSAALTGFDQFTVFALDRADPAITVVDEGGTRQLGEVVVLRYPSGTVLERRLATHAYEFRDHAPPDVRRAAAADFDGDGVADRIASPASGHSIVESGRDGSVLFESLDATVYESNERLTLLGDLDGDGCSELAVEHPRIDRSRYDFELQDLLFGVESWLTVVSGKRAIEERRARLAAESR